MYTQEISNETKKNVWKNQSKRRKKTDTQKKKMFLMLET